LRRGPQRERRLAATPVEGATDRVFGRLSGAKHDDVDNLKPGDIVNEI
jgi:hypothetical protein